MVEIDLGYAMTLATIWTLEHHFALAFEVGPKEKMYLVGFGAAEFNRFFPEAIHPTSFPQAGENFYPEGGRKPERS